MKAKVPNVAFKAVIVLVTLALFGSTAMWLFRDALSLIYWRARYFGTPRAVGSGPRVILPRSDSSGIGVNLAGISEEEWKVSHVWVPRVQSVTVSSNQTLITLGCWWDNSGKVSALPVDSNGTFVRALDRAVDLSHAPLQNQIAVQVGPAAGRHVITPPPIGARGDGYFLVLEVSGLDGKSLVRDGGQSRESHPMFGDGDPKTIQSIRVSTEGVAAQPGDLAVAVFSMDPCDNPDIRISLPDGWTSIGFNNVAMQNIGYRACCRIVTEAGRQSAMCSWTDDSTFVAEATIVIFKAERPSRP